MTQAPDAPRATVFDFMTRGQIKEFHEVFGRYIDWCNAQGLPQAASEPTDALDAARLDWLEARRHTNINVPLRSKRVVRIEYVSDDGCNEEAEGGSLRAAIDAAMAERPAEGNYARNLQSCGDSSL